MTTAANEPMIKVHDRMPLILEKGQMRDWFDDSFYNGTGERRQMRNIDAEERQKL